MPATIDLTDEALAVELEGADRLWALKRRLEVPLERCGCSVRTGLGVCRLELPIHRSFGACSL